VKPGRMAKRAIGKALVLHRGQESLGLRLDRLGKQLARTVTQH